MKRDNTVFVFENLRKKTNQYGVRYKQQENKSSQIEFPLNRRNTQWNLEIPTLKYHNDASFEGIIGFVFQRGIGACTLILFGSMSNKKW